MAAGAAVAVVGWWSGFKLGGIVTLETAEAFQTAGVENYWQVTFLVLGIVVILCNVGLLFVREARATERMDAQAEDEERIAARLHVSGPLGRAAAWLGGTVVGPIMRFFEKNGFAIAAAVLGFVFLFKIGEAFMGRVTSHPARRAMVIRRGGCAPLARGSRCVVVEARGGIAMALQKQIRSCEAAARESGNRAARRAGPGLRRRERAAAWLLALLCGLMAGAPEGHAAEGAERSAAMLVEWSSGESVERLSRSSHKADFFPLSNHFISQDNSIFCGPVSSAIVLNALRLGKQGELPKDRSSIAEDEMAWLWQDADPFYGKYTPNNVLTERTKTRLEVLGKPILIDGEAKRDYGLQLHQLAQVLRSHGLEVVTRVVDPGADASAIRREIVANLAAGEDFVLVNYARKALGQPGGGHISPLGAYDAPSDSFLVMDVNPNRAPWVWVGADALIAAMRTFDTVENRGYLLISEGE